MNLAEKLAALRGERKLSQGDLAEKLDVSRQSVSKWETGQAVPELDKIIKLADLFGVTVDELVRDGEISRPSAPRTETPLAQQETKIIYVEQRLTAIQILGIAMTAGGLLMLPLTLAAVELGCVGTFIAIAGLPLLLAKKHPIVAEGWVLWLMGYLLLCTPFVMGRLCHWQPFTGIAAWWPLRDEAYMPPAIWLIWLAFVGESALTLALPVCTGWLCWQKRKGCQTRQTAERQPKA